MLNMKFPLKPTRIGSSLGGALRVALKPRWKRSSLGDTAQFSMSAVTSPSPPSPTPTESSALLSNGLGRLSEYTFSRGSGSYLETTCGRSLLDFTSGIGVTNTGHSHPRVTEAAKRQIDDLVHGQVNIGYHPPMLELVEV